MKRYKGMVTAKCISASALLLLSAFAGGCGSQSQDKDNVIVVEQEVEEPEFVFGYVTIDDVEKSQRIKCTYKQVNDEELSFDVSGKLVKKVYVKEGDKVEKGQILAEIDGIDRKDDIARLEYQIARNKLLLEQNTINEQNEISMRWLNYIYGAWQSPEGEKALKDGIASLQQNNVYTREDLQDAINLDTAQLKAIKGDISQGKLVANMPGTVSKIKNKLVGSTTVKDEVVITVIDNTECLFESTKTEYAYAFKAEEQYLLDINGGVGVGKYWIAPYEMEKWEDTMLFTLLQDPSETTLAVGAYGNITISLEKKENVLCVPVEAVHSADGKDYVYVLGEGNLRDVRWIETGIHGDSKVEVLSGLSEGEKVILR